MATALDLNSLTPSQLELLDDEDLRDIYLLLEAEEAEKRHGELPVRDFIQDSHFLGNSTHWPAVTDVIEDIVLRDATEVSLCWGTGAGKSALGGALMCWHLYRILPSVADGSFFRKYKLGGDKPVFFFCLATRVEQVQQNLYREVRGRLERSPWFQQNFPHDPKAQAETWFLYGGERLPICVKPLPAREEAVLSYDTFCAAVDEAGWFVESTGTMGDSAQEIWDRIDSRMTSRFLGEGLLMNLSAPRYEADFSQRRCKEIEESGNPRLYASRKAIWDTKPELLKQLEKGTSFPSQHPVTGETWQIPNALAVQFAKDPGTAWRDFGAVPSGAVEAFDASAAESLERCCSLPSLPAVQRQYSCRIHIDIGLKHDKCAMAMCYGVGEKVTLARAVVIEPRGDTQTVEIEDVRAQVKHWRAQGWLISGITADRFQSTDLLQRLHRDGFPTSVLSVDMDVAHYVLLRTMLHQGDFAFCRSEETDLFCKEYRRLMLVKGSRVDHPPRGSKDMADAICGAASEANANAASGKPLTDRVLGSA